MIGCAKCHEMLQKQLAVSTHCIQILIRRVVIKGWI